MKKLMFLLRNGTLKELGPKRVDLEQINWFDLASLTPGKNNLTLLLNKQVTINPGKKQLLLFHLQ